MRKYQRMTLAVRCHIYALFQEGYSISEIARRVGYHKSLISREFSRNRATIKYSPQSSENRFRQRQKNQGRKRLIDGVYFELIKDRMKEGWSPQQIAGRLRNEGYDFCCYQTIYNFIKREKQNRTKYNLSRFLRRFGRRGYSSYSRKKKNFYNPHNISIQERPEEINSRNNFGHWERDCMYIADRNQIVVLTERKSRLTLLRYIGKPKVESMIDITDHLFKRVEHKALSITQDNGPEFTGLPKEAFKRFRCDPRRPDQRGTVENSIGLLRQYIKRKDKWKNLGASKLLEAQNRLNNRPRKTLNYKTAREVFLEHNVAIET